MPVSLPLSLFKKKTINLTFHFSPGQQKVWDSKPLNKTDPINWVELKTSATIENDRDAVKYERKLLKFWIQSFLLGVPKIIVGFRSKRGVLERIEELDTNSIPGTVKKNQGAWDGNVCINFTAGVLECKHPVLFLFSFGSSKF